MSKNKSKAKNPFASSLIISLFGRASAFIYRKLEGGYIGKIFTSYGAENKACAESASAKVLSRTGVSEKVFMPAKRRVASLIEDSMLLGYVRKKLDGLLTSSMKAYGIFLFSAALYSAIVYLFKLFYSYGGTAPDVTLIVTLITMLIMSVMMIAARQSLASALATSPVSRFILFTVIGIRKESIEGKPAHDGKYNIAFIAGLVFGMMSYFVHPLILLLGLIGAVVAYLVLIKPEFGVLAIVTALPFAPTMMLVAAVLYVSVCYFIKVMCGKRSVKLDLLDAIVLLFMLLMIGGGVFSMSSLSLKPMLVYAAFMLGYFLVVNLVRSKEWVMRCSIGAVASCAVVALYGLYQNFFGVVEQTWQDSDMFSEIKGRVVSTFENPNVLAEYLIMVLPLILALFIVIKSPRARFALGAAGIFVGGCLIYTWSRGAWLGFMIGIIVFMLMYSRHTLSAMLFALLGVPFLPLVLPDSIISRFTSIGDLADSSTSYRVNIWYGVIDMLKDHWQGGIGIGNGAFSTVYPLYALSGIETAPHAHNLYLQITVELGVFGLVVFAVLMFIFAQGSFEVHASEKRSEKLISSALFCGLLAVLAQGMTDYIWYNYRVFFMFWLMLGLSAATRRMLNATSHEDIY